MITTELIKLLKDHEFGAATGKVREVTVSVPGYGYIGEPNVTIDSTDDGLYTGICLRLTPEDGYPIDDETGEDVTHLAFTDDDMDMIRLYQEVSGSVSAEVAVMNAISLMLDYVDDGK